MTGFGTMTLEEYRAAKHKGRGKKNKYNAKKTPYNGVIYDSKREAERAAELDLLVKAGQITDLERQPEFVLQEGFTDQSGKRHRAITYRADFRYREPGNPPPVVEDVKGKETDVFKLKWKMVLKRYGHLYDFRIVK